MFIVFIVFSLRQADDPLTFKTVFSLNPSYLVDKYFCFVTLGESQRWIKEGDKDQEEEEKKKEASLHYQTGLILRRLRLDTVLLSIR